MGVASLANVPYDENTLREFSFSHMAHHRDIIRRIRELTNAELEEFPLDPFEPSNSAVWGYHHQQMHNQMNTILGISGNDLIEINWQDKGERESWVFLNFNEHVQASDKLGV